MTKKKLESPEIKSRLLSMASDIIDELDKNNINYSIFYGSLLGAIRHKGFIPWDDDFDIVIRAKDIKKLRAISKGELSKKYDFFNSSDCDNYTDWVSRFSDKETEVRINNLASQANSADFSRNNIGLAIDFYPVFELPDNQSFKSFCLFFHRVSSFLRYKASNSNNRFFIKLSDVIDHLLARVSGTESVIPADYKLIYKESIFEKQKELSFEAETFKGPLNSELFLEQRYGDWTRIPSEKEREAWIHYEEIYLKD